MFPSSGRCLAGFSRFTHGTRMLVNDRPALVIDRDHYVDERDPIGDGPGYIVAWREGPGRIGFTWPEVYAFEQVGTEDGVGLYRAENCVIVARGEMSLAAKRDRIDRVLAAYGIPDRSPIPITRAFCH